MKRLSNRAPFKDVVDTGLDIDVDTDIDSMGCTRGLEGGSIGVI